MRKLSSIIGSIILSVSLFGQTSPHGAAFDISCTDCHKTDGWNVNSETMLFSHRSTNFPLVGQHQQVSCKECHKTLEFNKAPSQCADCHTDVHEQTVGTECARCHTPNSWIVANITQLHQQSRFPLIGPHASADCRDCHKNMLSTVPLTSVLRFDPLGIACYDCHKDDYLAATQPNHVASNYSTQCTDCHNMNVFTWSGAGINHNFFPLTGGHAIDDCRACHTSGSYSKIPSACVSCHQTDYESTTNPSHIALNFTTQCTDCHTTNPGWKPAEYRSHDAAYFPIYSGEHRGEWNSCADCHTNPSNYAEFSCINCHEHERGDMDEEHGGIGGYIYSSDACYSCHPTGSEEGSFNHSKSAFPLTGAHTTTDCSDCHTNGYSGTPNTCSGCHTPNYNQTTNPNHTSLGISTDCAACHTTSVDWKPATFANHDAYYLLQGAHRNIANDCFTCHNGVYTNSDRSCFTCHTQDFNLSTNPSHTAAQFPTTCEECHSQTAWTPSTFNHDGKYFPIYSGKHDGEWNVCSDCHKEPTNFAVFTCTTSCHSKAETDNDHDEINDYTYESNACLNCHPDGSDKKGGIKPTYRQY
ncbi:MAG TPA: hypothetical protein DCQ26_10560 [Marinilabiliales bacterium]|nr:MAG: hypothetical protein A2W95_13705 [Bacteroidetes bacterium GWA2_40_14]OFZ24567.1 MAG: hypothetical protein A2437_16815 [Bacteroidetes bacterium RIFOXYC2_FULL_40_12]HAM99039.1 hypothetical protein [Marinilabiliales bacterium]HAZ01777.1 hypothetical protein [Marinilabiliales bacterium]HBO74430.1 hypothetical protein [Marinilabiliales bacterium]